MNTTASARLNRTLSAFDPRTPFIAVGRSGLAAAGLLLLLLNPDTALFPPSPEVPGGVRCSGISSVSLWCLSDAAGLSMNVPRVIALAVLGLVLVGLRPKWTAVPHWYVAFSLALSLPVPNGGESVTQVATMLLIPLCLSDDRTWHWVRPVGRPPGRARGRAYAVLLALRAQTSIIYLFAAVSKFSVPEWRDGGAMSVIAHHPLYGFPISLITWLDALPWWPVASMGLTWGAMLLEVAVAVGLWCGRRARRFALLLGCVLHLGITVFMGLAGFELVMVSLLILVAFDGRPGGTVVSEDSALERR